MKVAILSTFYPYRGGISQFNAALYRAFEIAGHAPHAFNFSRQYPSILFPGKTQYVTKEDSADEIPNERVLDVINPLTWHRTSANINRLNPDMVVLPFWTPFHGPALGAVAKRLTCRRKVGLIHNLIPHESRRTDRMLTMQFLKHVDEVWVLSEAVKADVLGLRPELLVKVHPHPLYTHFQPRLEKSLACERLGLNPHIPVFLFFGLIRPYKGLDILIKAIKEINQDVQLVVAGEAYEDFDKYRSLAKALGVDRQIQFHNRYIPDHEIPTFFGAADAVVLPYRRASQSGVTAIALNYNLPIIASNVGGLSEYIIDGDSGLLVTPEDSEDLAKKMLYFSTHTRHFSNPIPFKKIKESLSWDHFINTLC